MMTDQPLTSQDVNQQTFTRGLRGYAMDEVDEFLDLVAAELDRLQRGVGGDVWDSRPLVAAQEVHNKEFTGAVRGYAMREVDEFLDRVAVALDELQRQPPPAAEPEAPPLNPRDIAPREFARASVGYSVHEVDRFLDLVAREVGYLQNARAQGYHPSTYFLTPSDIERIAFTKATPGYHTGEVDEFLDRVMEELARLQDTASPPPRSEGPGPP